MPTTRAPHKKSASPESIEVAARLRTMVELETAIIESIERGEIDGAQLSPLRRRIDSASLALAGIDDPKEVLVIIVHSISQAAAVVADRKRSIADAVDDVTKVVAHTFPGLKEMFVVHRSELLDTIRACIPSPGRGKKKGLRKWDALAHFLRHLGVTSDAEALRRRFDRGRSK
jgi:hypothetical protein